MTRQSRTTAPPGATRSVDAAEATPSAAGSGQDASAPARDAVVAAEPSRPAEPAASERERDLLFVHSPCERGDGYHVLRRRGGRLEVGEIRGLREGQPIRGEVVRLTPREESERLFDVDVVLAEPARPSRSGPPQVTTDDYRRGWDAIFGGRAAQRSGQSPN